MFSSCSLRSALVTLVMETAASTEERKCSNYMRPPKPQQSTLVTGTCEAKCCPIQARIDTVRYRRRPRNTKPENQDRKGMMKLELTVGPFCPPCTSVSSVVNVFSWG